VRSQFCLQYKRGRREHYDYIMDVTQFKSAKGRAENHLPKIPTKIKAALTRAVNTLSVKCCVQPETKTTVGVKRTARSIEAEASIDAAIKPELGIIVDDIMVKEEPEEEDIDEDKVKEEMKKSGYNLLEPDKKKAKSLKGLMLSGSSNLKIKYYVYKSRDLTIKYTFF